MFKRFDELKPLKIDLSDNKQLEEIIKLVINIFGKIPAGKLSTWSHTDGSPWALMNKQGAKYGDSLNPIEVRNYFRKFLRIDNAK